MNKTILILICIVVLALLGFVVWFLTWNQQPIEATKELKESTVTYTSSEQRELEKEKILLQRHKTVNAILEEKLKRERLTAAQEPSLLAVKIKRLCLNYGYCLSWE